MCGIQEKKISWWGYLYGQLSGWLQYQCPQRSAARRCCCVLTLLNLRIRFSVPCICREGVSAHGSRFAAMQQLQNGQTKGQSLS